MAREYDGPEVIIESDGGAAGVKWFLAGALIGAAVAILYAPQSGERTRREISRKAKRLREDMSERLEDVRDEVTDRSKQLKSAAHDLADNVKGEVRDGRRAIRKTASNAREELKHRIEDARTRRRSSAAEDSELGEDDEAVV